MKRKAWLLGIVSLIFAAFLSLPFFFSLFAQHLLKEMNGLRVPLKNGEWGALEFQVNEINRYWWHSRATVNMAYHAPASGNQIPAKSILTADVKITHGPFLWRISSSENRPIWGQAWVEAPVSYVKESFPPRFLQVTGTNAGMVKSYIALSGAQTAFVDTEEISFQDESGQLNFSGAALKINRSPAGKELAMTFHAPHFNFVLYPKTTTSGARWLIDGIAIKFDGILDHPAALWYGTWFGKSNIALDMLQAEADGTQYTINQFSYNSIHNADKNEQIMKGESKLKLESISIGQNSMGPLSANIIYSHIDRVALEDMRKLYDAWFSSTSKLPFLASLTVEQQEEFYADVLAFVNRKPSYSVEDFLLVTELGPASGNFSMEVVGPAKDVYALRNMKYWQQNINAKLDLSMAQSLSENIAEWGVGEFYAWLNPLLNVPQPPAIVDPASPEESAQPTPPALDYHVEGLNLLKQAEMFGFVRNEDQKYYTEAKYQQGLLTINGKLVLDLSAGAKASATPLQP